MCCRSMNVSTYKFDQAADLFPHCVLWRCLSANPVLTPVATYCQTHSCGFLGCEQAADTHTPHSTHHTSVFPSLSSVANNLPISSFPLSLSPSSSLPPPHSFLSLFPSRCTPIILQTTSPHRKLQLSWRFISA